MVASIVSTCSVCNSKDLSEVNDLLDGGVSLRRLEERYGLSRSALSRHRRFHLPGDQLPPEDQPPDFPLPVVDDHTPEEWMRLLTDRVQHFVASYRAGEPARERARRFMEVVAIVSPSLAAPLHGLSHLIQHSEPYQVRPLHPPAHRSEDERKRQLELQAETINTLKQANEEERAL